MCCNEGEILRLSLILCDKLKEKLAHQPLIPRALDGGGVFLEETTPGHHDRKVSSSDREKLCTDLQWCFKSMAVKRIHKSHQVLFPLICNRLVFLTVLVFILQLCRTTPRARTGTSGIKSSTVMISSERLTHYFIFIQHCYWFSA